MFTSISRMPSLLIVLSFFIGNITYCEDAPCLAPKPSTPARASSDTESASQAIVAGNVRFALNLYAQLKKDGGNAFFSPYSISTALAMTYFGARGDTASEMKTTLQFPFIAKRLGPAFAVVQKTLNGHDAGAYELHIANRLWGQRGYSFKKDFLSACKTYFDSGLATVDFSGDTESARKTINAWVEDKTRQRIKNLIGKGILTLSTKLVLTNAVYFKSQWVDCFETYATRNASFTTESGKQVDIPMMHATAEYRYMENDAVQILDMPYKYDALSMIVILPKKTDGLKDVEAKLTADNLNGWLDKMKPQRVAVSFPKFRIESQFLLGKVLEKMGMQKAFQPGAADFSGMDGSRRLYIGHVIHKAFVDVDENGTEAAAATAVSVTITCVPATEPIPFVAEHPFLFMIRDNATGSILFMGRVANPKSEK